MKLTIFRQYGYVPFHVVDDSSMGSHTREASRTVEVIYMQLAGY